MSRFATSSTSMPALAFERPHVHDALVRDEPSAPLVDEREVIGARRCAM